MRGNGALGHLQQGPWNLLAILTCACLSRYLLERPMNRLGHRLSALSLRRAEAARQFAPAPERRAREVRGGAVRRLFRIRRVPDR